MNTQRLRRLARRVAVTVAEMNEAQLRMIEPRLAQDRGHESGLPPENYDEFLMRTSGLRLHEPSASER